jgi:hypothetical protein
MKKKLSLEQKSALVFIFISLGYLYDGKNLKFGTLVFIGPGFLATLLALSIIILSIILFFRKK